MSVAGDQKVRDTTPLLWNPIPVKFLIPSEESRKTRWRWCRDAGEMHLDGEQVILNGRRWRPFLPGKPQSIHFLRNDIHDVEQQGDRVVCTVVLEDGKQEPLALQFGSEEIAREVAARWPNVRTAISLEQETFQQALARSGGRVWATPALAGICVLVFIAMVASGVPLAPRGPELIPWGTNFGPRTLRGEPWRLFTSIFLHFGVVHLLLNSLSLVSLGPLTEKLLGSARFLILYIVSGLCGSMMSLLWNPAVNSAGASGAIFGVMGALLAIMVNPVSRVPAMVAANYRNSALLFLGLNALNSLRPGIDMAAHLAGFGAGFVLGWLFTRPMPEAGQSPPRLNPVPGGAVAVGLLAALALLLFHPGAEAVSRRAFRFSVAEFSAAEEAALGREAQLRKLLGDGEITDRQWAERTQAEVVPLWDNALDASLLVPAGNTRAQRDLSVLLSKYASTQILATGLYAEAILQDDQSKRKEADDFSRRQRTRQEIIRGLIKKL
jgi:rhomboid protease GluP